MDPRLNFGFPENVSDLCPREEIPQFPAPPGFQSMSHPPTRYGQAPPPLYHPAPPTGYGQAPPPGYHPAPPTGYGQVPPPGYHPAPPTGYGQVPPPGYHPAPPTGYGQAPPPGYHPAPPTGYGQAPPPGYHPAPPTGYDPPPPPPVIYGQAPPIGFAPASVLGPAPCTPVAAAPYGFLSDNWLEEQQSWFPRPPTPPACSQDGEAPALPLSGGFRIGFEQHHMADPSLHYHDMGSAPAGGDTPGLRAPHYGHHTQAGGDWRIDLQEAPLRPDSEVAAFCDAVWRIRQGYSASHRPSNPDRIWSIAVPPAPKLPDTEVEVSIIREELSPALRTTQRGSTLVSHIIADVLQQIPARALAHRLYPTLSHDLHPASVPPGEEAEPAGGGCYLSICGLDEYLHPGLSLCSHIVLQRERRICLRLHIGGRSRYRLARTVEDDETELTLGGRLEHAQYWQELRKRLFVAVSEYEDQVLSFLHDRSSGVGPLLEAVQDLCYLLRSVETLEISTAVQNLRGTAQNPPTMVPDQSPHPTDPRLLLLGALSGGILRLLALYSCSFLTDFVTVTPREERRPERRSALLTFHLHTVHNLPETWAKSDHAFHVSCSVIYAGRKICAEVKSRNVAASRSFFYRLVWDETIQLPLPASSLPYESMLVLRLCALSPTAPRGSVIAWSCLPLYSDQRVVEGKRLLNMISHCEPPAVITPGGFDISLPTLITVQLDFPFSGAVYQRPAVSEETMYDPSAVDGAPALLTLAHRGSVLLLSQEDKQCLWYYRRSPQKPPDILPLLLGSAPGWDPPSISAMYRVLSDWTFSGPLEALPLLSPCFADEWIRGAACRQLERLSCDEILMFLPQLVQALKFEWRLNNALLRLLLHQSLRSIQVAHRVYWLLTDGTADPHYGGMYRRLLEALERCTGRALTDQFHREKRLLRLLQNIAESVKSATEDKREEALKLGLRDIDLFFEEVTECRLPLNPAIVVRGIDPELCSVFRSNARPLKISFINADPQGPNIHVMYKVSAPDNFLYSCAGWCVVTFVLGVGDRHNDNIMLTSSAHMFHIDFGKIMGNAQMFGKIKRDRAPFIFTSEMEAFITQEGRSPHRAQEFVELCCSAYNILRRHSTLIITLLELMLQAGLPELRSVDDLRYVHDRLRPYDSDAQAASYFSSKIRESLENPSVKLNFLVHAFANMTPSDLSRMGESVPPALGKFIRRAAVKSVRKVQRVGERILNELGVIGDADPVGPAAGAAPRVQLHVSFSVPRLHVVLRHLRDIYMPDGSEPTASVTISLLSGPWEVSRRNITSRTRTCAPDFNQQVEFSVRHLDGFVLRLVVESDGTFLGAVTLPLSSIRLQEDAGYHLSRD
ncbi:phosphatidylinositol 3-kinase C2 domain-containing subunit gamma-like [Engystomops pustulosus]|uniref:phosphatidylinositol 3-kinase C2 domain-containing subunit gamma-like n=1 Tax=Engystomops pustulosus TaxID=76066 RepID=UPI003AFAD476